MVVQWSIVVGVEEPVLYDSRTTEVVDVDVGVVADARPLRGIVRGYGAERPELVVQKVVGGGVASEGGRSRGCGDQTGGAVGVPLHQGRGRNDVIDRRGEEFLSVREMQHRSVS